MGRARVLAAGLLTLAASFADLLGFEPSGGIDRFRVLGIETDAMLDPGNAAAFVTGLTFASAGRFTGTMTPITQFVPASEPATALVFATGIVALLRARRRREA